MAASAIDMALHLSLVWCLRRFKGQPAGWRDVFRENGPPWLRLVGPTSALVHEQVGSPGQRALAVRTVDRRTGIRVAAWKSLVLAASTFVAGVYVERTSREAMTPERVAERERFLREWEEINERHADDAEARAAAREEWAKRHSSDGCAGRFAALALAQNLLRRRLAPTTDVSVRSRG